MLTCPQCKKTWPEPVRQCPTCQTDLSLLADFLVGIAEGLSRAEAHVKGGELGQAVREYLAVLEVDPENETARRRLAEWARAVRHFGRPRRKRRRRRPPPAPEPAAPPPVNQPPCPPQPQPSSIPARLVVVAAWGMLIIAFGMGFLAGSLWGGRPAAPAAAVTTPQE